MPRTAGREASPTVAIIDSQSVKSAEKGGGLSICAGMTRAKRIKGKQRHLLVDTQGLRCQVPSSMPPTFRIVMEVCR